MTLRELFLATAEKNAARLFLSDTTHSLTYQMALEQVYVRSHSLLKASIQHGERVIIVDEVPLETTLWLLACSLIGAVFVILHQNTSVERMKYLLQHVKPVGVIDLRSGAERLYQTLPELRLVITTKLGKTDSLLYEPLPAIDLIETDTAFLVYTSGSTGRPEAVICPHCSVTWVTASINSYLPNAPDDKIGHFLSLSFVYGLYQIFLAIHAQAAVIFLGQFRSGHELVTRLTDHQITAFPATRAILVSLTRFEHQFSLPSSLKYISCAGDYLPVVLLKKILSICERQRFFYMYGLSECARALYMPPERLPDKPSSVGVPIPGTRAFVVNEYGTICSAGEVGELIVEGPHVMRGYWGAPEETQKRFNSGLYGQPRLRTGDLFFQDRDGDFHFVGRKSDLIKSKGFRISPREVEAAIFAADPVIQECMAYGVEDELLGQAIHVQVIVNDPVHTINDIYTRCRSSMDAHLIPKKIQIVHTLPTTASGKYYRREDA